MWLKDTKKGYFFSSFGFLLLAENLNSPLLLKDEMEGYKFSIAGPISVERQLSCQSPYCSSTSGILVSCSLQLHSFSAPSFSIFYIVRFLAKDTWWNIRSTVRWYLTSAILSLYQIISECSRMINWVWWGGGGRGYGVWHRILAKKGRNI